MRRLAGMILCCLILSGCSLGASSSERASHSVFPETGIWSENQGPISDADLTAYEVLDFWCMGSDLILAHLQNETVMLTLLTGEELQPVKTVPTTLSQDFSQTDVDCRADSFSYLSYAQECYIVLDPQLREISSIPLPGPSVSSARLSSDGGLLYYTTRDRVCVKELSSGISKLIREANGTYPVIKGLFHNDTVLLCMVGQPGDASASIFLSTEDGTVLSTFPQDLAAVSYGETVCMTYYQAPEDRVLLTGAQGETKELLLLPDSRFLAFLPNGDIASITQGSQTALDCFSGGTGTRIAHIPLDGTYKVIRSHGDLQGNLYLLLSQDRSLRFIRWRPSDTPIAEDPTCYFSPYYTEDAPDSSGLSLCAQIAEEIGNRHGVAVRIYQEAVSCQPWDYRLEPEYRVPLIERKLDSIDACLSSFPAGFLQALSEDAQPITICLVQSIRGVPGTDSLAYAEGLQFRAQGQSCLALTCSPDLRHNLYHELAHLIDTKVISCCNAFDNWQALNPEGFSYSYDSTQWQTEADSPFLQGENRAFLDAYSMTYPTEDRARILEYALTEDHKALFDSPILQEKLRQICIGIRRAFDLTRSPENYPWEQYLWNSISYRVMQRHQ